MSALPIRLRLAGAFGLAMAVVLAALATFVYLRLTHDMTIDLDRRLRLRGDDIALLVQQPGASLATTPTAGLIEQGESFAQLLRPDGSVLDGTPPLGSEPLLDAQERRRAESGARFLDRAAVPGLDEPSRLLAFPLERDGEQLLLVVGTTAEDRAEALADLRNALLIAGPIALLLTVALGYRLAGSALRAVEAMRRRAAEITGARAGERLPVPAADDELGRLATTLNSMLERLELALARERGFVADAGHELRTPLALLRSELDFALQHARDEQELREAVERASEETDRLAQLAGDLLLLASVDDGKLPLRVERLPAGALLESVRNRFLVRAAASGREIASDAEPGLAFAGDRLRLEQALGNLVDNALRHGAGTVRLTARNVPGAVELEVADAGPGFPPAFLPRAFERFSRPDEGRGGSGSGLGLAIVEAVAGAHGGSVSAANAPEGGGVVTLRLPAPVHVAAEDVGAAPLAVAPPPDV